MATKRVASPQAMGKMKSAKAEQAKVRRRMLGKATAMSNALQRSDMSSERYKDPKTGKTYPIDSDSPWATGDRLKDAKYVDNQVKATRGRAKLNKKAK